MTSDLLLTPRLISRIVTFVVTLLLGIGLGQLVPLSGFGNSKAEVPVIKQVKTDCPYRRR